MEIYKLQKPDHDAKIDRILDLIQPADIAKYVEPANRPEYLYWDKVRYKPRPEGVTPEELWALVKLTRRFSPSRISTAVKNTRGEYFTWQLLKGYDYFFHEVDLKLGGALETSIVEGESARQKFIARGIMEEAIASSQLEGANTTRRAAKKMLWEKRKPTNRSEQMILNNYNAMLLIEERLNTGDLTLDVLLELHATLTRKTIEDDQVGSFRRDADQVVICDAGSGVIYHVPPPVRFMKREIKRLIDYANDDPPASHFVHPLIKAIILHFWIGYLHPFTDGNGRLARAIFYWYLLRQGYWAFSYLPVSRIIRNSPVQYRDAYIYSEQDDNDLTYFIDYNVRKISQAQRDFERYVKRKQAENRKMARVAEAGYHLNERQIQLLRYLHKDPRATTSIKTHSHIYGVSRMTAQKDLERLEELGLVKSHKVGRARPFRGTDKLSRLFD